MPEEHICIVVPVVLRPDPTTPDTACFGVIVTCAETGFCGFRLAQGDEEAIARIVGFFPRYGRKNFEQALAWAAHDIQYAFDREKRTPGAFANLIRRRENVIQYGSPQSSLAADPADELNRQYERFVHYRQ